jgi:WD40 repeat protein
MGPITWQPLPSGLSAIYAVALTRDGQFAACGRANQIFIYHVPSGQLAGRLNDPRLQKIANIGAAHRDTVNSLAFSPDGELLASGGYRDVKLWRRVKPKFRIVDAGKVEAFASIGDGQWTATVNSNGDISFLGSDGRIVKTLAGRGVRPSALRFNQDASRFAVAIDSTVEVWSVEQGRRIARTEISSPVTALAWIDEKLAAGSDDGTIRVLAISTNGELRMSREWKTQSAIVALESTVTNQLVSASADGFVRIWDLAADKSLFEAKHSGSITALAVRGDGKYLAAAGANSASLWNVSQTKSVTELKGDRRAVDVMAESERELTFAKSELDYRKGALKAAETNHTSILARQKKATETNAVIAKLFAEKQTALTNAVRRAA